MLNLFLFLHIMAALFWVGGMLFLTIVVAPFLLRMEDARERSAVYQEVGSRYRFWGWIAIATLLVTGPLNLYFLGVSPSLIFDASFHTTTYGKVLMAKLTFVSIIVVSSLLHDFWLGPRARSSPRFSTLARIFGRSNLALAIVIVILAVLLRTGGG
ncbi:MAG TPA: DUF4149 domain-containing protein [Deltaproteobacteria bacterium]|nr:DUF4149 domain-containing protein [Deltaproteobacteria bacterium]